MVDTPINRKSRRPWRVLLIGCGAIFGFVVLGCIVLYLKSPGRYRVVGPIDPETGIGIEYTVSPRYIRKPDEEDRSRHPKPDGFPAWQYRPTHASDSPLSKWFRKYFLKEPEPVMASWGVYQTSSKHAGITGMYIDPRGYPSVDLKRSGGMIVMAGVASQDYRMVGDCPTTLVVEDGDLVDNGHPNQYYDLLVCPRGQKIIYIFQATGFEGETGNPDLRELKAIRDSIHIIHVK